MWACTVGSQHTEAEDEAEHIPAHFTKHESTGIIDTVDFTMSQLEHANNVVGPCRDGGESNETEHPWHQPESIKRSRDRQHPQTDLGLHHEGHRSEPSNLIKVIPMS